MTQWGLDTLFNPAKRHMDKEKQRLQSTREEVGDNSGGKRVDLESGKVRITRANADDEGTTDADTTDATETTDTDVPTLGTTSGKGPSSKGSRGAASATGARGAKGSKGSRGAEASKGSTGAPSAAQVRAAQRRGRTAR